MKRLVLVLGASVLALSACKGASPEGSSGAPPPAAEASGSAAAAANAVSAAPATGGSGAQAAAEAPPPNPGATPRLAYKYEYGIEAPPDKIRDLVSREEQACQAAGQAACEITGVNVTQPAPDQVTAQVTFKATPTWLNGYESRLAAEAKADGGQIDKTNITTDDLSKQIVDTQAAITEKTAVRDRLQALLQQNRGTVQELQDLQAQLAAAQTDLDTTRAELADMSERVTTADVTLDFESSGVLAPRSAWAPVGSAVSHVADILAGTIAAIIYALALVGPWVALVGGGFWLLNRRKGKTKPAAPPPA
jgi:hypothetical protein